MILQSLTDELRRELPNRNFTLSFQNLWDGFGAIGASKSEFYQSLSDVGYVEWGNGKEAKTPDEALSLLKQRLGIDSEEK